MEKISKILALLLCAAMVFAFAACGGAKQPDRELSYPTSGTPVNENGEPIDEINVPPSTIEEAEALLNPDSQPVDPIENPDEDQPEADPEPKEQKSTEPTYADIEPTVATSIATSEDADLYLWRDNNGVDYAVSSAGSVVPGYFVDEEGNIMSNDGQQIVAAKNVAVFNPIKRMSFTKGTYSVELHAQEDTVGGNGYVTRINQYVTNVTILLSVTPTDATNGVILVRPSDLRVAEIRTNNNIAIMAEGAFNLEDGQVAIKAADPTREIPIVVTMKQIGDVKIIAEALSGNASADCVVSVCEGKVQSLPQPTEPPTQRLNASGDDTNHYHTHSYRMTVVEPTATSQGYTEYVCPDCGYSYRDNYTAKLPAPEPVAPPHVHSYTSTVVAPTATERGYTLHTCSCGDSYKDSYVPALGE